MKKTPKGIILLAIFLGWAIMNTISRMFLRIDSMDMSLYGHYNLIWLGYILASIVLILNVACLFAIIKKVNVLYAFFALNIIMTLFVTILSLIDFDVMKNVAIESRLSRGLSIDNMESIMTPFTVVLGIFAYAGFYGLLGFYVHKKRKYFTN